MEALSKHANIKPVITSTGNKYYIVSYSSYQLPFSSPKHTRGHTYVYSHARTHMYKHVCEKTCMYLLLNTVWKELEKENKEFFEAYARKNAERATVMETRERIEKMLANSTTIRDTK